MAKNSTPPKQIEHSQTVRNTNCISMDAACIINIRLFKDQTDFLIDDCRVGSSDSICQNHNKHNPRSSGVCRHSQSARRHDWRSPILHRNAHIGFISPLLGTYTGRSWLTRWQNLCKREYPANTKFSSRFSS